MSQVTSAFTEYPMEGLHQAALDYDQKNGSYFQNEPLPKRVGGGCVNLLVGIKAGELMPQLLHNLPGGLCVFRMKLADAWGSRIAFAGPTVEFTDTMKRRFGAWWMD